MMKKMITLAAALFVGAMVVNADDIDHTFEFVDADGNVVADGSTLTLTKVVDDEFIGTYISSGLYVKNTTNATASVAADYTLSALDNGTLQICFPTLCVAKTSTGSYTTATGDLTAGEKRNLSAEWIFSASGTCVMTIHLKVMKKSAEYPYPSSVVAYGPKVTMNFVYDPTGINSVSTDKTPTTNVYDATGKLVVAGADKSAEERLGKGLYIYETMQNGKRVDVKKVVK